MKTLTTILTIVFVLTPSNPGIRLNLNEAVGAELQLREAPPRPVLRETIKLMPTSTVTDIWRAYNESRGFREIDGICLDPYDYFIDQPDAIFPIDVVNNHGIVVDSTHIAFYSTAMTVHGEPRRVNAQIEDFDQSKDSTKEIDVFLVISTNDSLIEIHSKGRRFSLSDNVCDFGWPCTMVSFSPCRMILITYPPEPEYGPWWVDEKYKSKIEELGRKVFAEPTIYYRFVAPKPYTIYTLIPENVVVKDSPSRIIERRKNEWKVWQEFLDSWGFLGLNFGQIKREKFLSSR